MNSRHGFIFLFAIAGAAPLPTWPAAESHVDGAAASMTRGESLAERELRDLLVQEQAIWERLEGREGEEHARLRAETEFRDVISGYQNLLAANPEFAEAYATYGLLLSRVGARDEALRALVKANQLDPNIPMVKNQIGNHLTEDGEYQAALPYYLAAIELDGDEPLYHYQLGTLLYEFRKFFIADGAFDRQTLDREMQTAFRKAAELAPGTWAYAYRYAESFYDLETADWPAALEVWGRLNTRAKPGVEQQTIQLHMARVLVNMGRHDEAKALLAGVDEPVLEASKQSVEKLLQPEDTSEAR